MRSSRHRDYPIINRRGKYIGTISRRNLIGNRKKQVILVDHNEKSQAADNIEEANILEIIDHHRLGSLETMAPVLFRNQPVGCTATIMYQIYQERNLEIPQNIAGLLCAAIISDTLLFRSPTCTPVSYTHLWNDKRRSVSGPNRISGTSGGVKGLTIFGILYII